jgi:steroid delta-isomerase-like uncharacterized protein
MAAQESAAREFYEAFNRRQFDRAADLVADGCEWVNVPFGKSYRGRAGAREFIAGWAAAVPDCRVEVMNLVAGGDHIVVELFFRGTHTGPLDAPGGAIRPTGNKIEMPVCDCIHFQGGKIDSVRTYFDAATLMRQLGLLTGAWSALQGASFQPSAVPPNVSPMAKEY